MNNRIYGPLQPLGRPQEGTNRAKSQQPVEKGDFSRILEQVQSEIKFSRHAQQRLATRQISLSSGEVERLQVAVEKAAGKGARESLVLLDDLAFVVSVKNRTVITAMDGESIREHVFTNIDSAVIAK